MQQREIQEPNEGSITITISRYIPPAEVGSSPSAAIEGYEGIGGEEGEKEGCDQSFSHNLTCNTRAICSLTGGALESHQKYNHRTLLKTSKDSHVLLYPTHHIG